MTSKSPHQVLFIEGDDLSVSPFWDLVEIVSLLGQGLGLGLGLDKNLGITYMYKVEVGSLFMLLIVNRDLHST